MGTQEERGSSAVEFTLLVTAIAAGVVGAVSLAGQNLRALLESAVTVLPGG